MKELERHKILGGDGKTMVWVYDGLDVEYCPTKGSAEYRYYKKDGKRFKTRPYSQYTGMTNRCLKDGAHKRIYKTYNDVKMSDDFSTFEKWKQWAETQVGFMWVDYNGYLFQQDKDLLGDGSLYSKDTCCFIPRILNMCLLSLEGENVLRYQDRGVGFELKQSFRVFDYKYLDFIARHNSLVCIKRALFESFMVLDDLVLESIFKRISKQVHKLEKAAFMVGKIRCIN